MQTNKSKKNTLILTIFLIVIINNLMGQNKRTVTDLSYNTFTKQNPPKSKITNQKILKWLDTQIEENAPIKTTLVKNITRSLILKKRYVEPFHVEENFIIIPLLNNKISKNESKNTHDYLKFLLLVEDSKGEIRRGDLIFFKPLKSKQNSLPYNTFYELFINQEPTIDGTFTLISLSDTKQFEDDFENRTRIESRSWICDNCYEENKTNNERNWLLRIRKFNSDGTFETTEKALGKTKKNCPPGVNCD